MLSSCPMLNSIPFSKSTCMSLVYSMKKRAVNMYVRHSPKKNPVPTFPACLLYRCHPMKNNMMYAMASYSCPGWRGSMSTRSKTNAHGTSVTLPIISEFIRFPILMRHAVSGVAMAMLSNTRHIDSFVLRTYSHRAIIRPRVPPWLASPS